MQHIMALHIPSLTLNSMPSGYLCCQATAVVKAEPLPFPTPNDNWSYFIGTVNQYMYDGKESKKHLELLNVIGEGLANVFSSSILPLSSTLHIYVLDNCSQILGESETIDCYDKSKCSCHRSLNFGRHSADLSSSDDSLSVNTFRRQPSSITIEY